MDGCIFAQMYIHLVVHVAKWGLGRGLRLHGILSANRAAGLA
jgi:hypothetical protein